MHLVFSEHAHCSGRSFVGVGGGASISMETRIQGFSQLCNRTVTMTIFMVRVEGKKKGGEQSSLCLKGDPW